MKRTLKLAVAFMAFMLLALAACGGEEPSPREEGEPAAESAERLRVAMLLPGRIEDKAFSAFGKQALDEIASQLGAETDFQEEVTPAQQLAALRDFARQGFDLVIGWGGEFMDDALRVGEEFPDVSFAVMPGSTGNERNVGGFKVAAEQWKYVQGALAGYLTKTDKIGYMTGICFPDLAAFANGARRGAEAVNPDVRYSVVYTGDFLDAAKAKEAALAMIGQGVDVIIVTLDRGFFGAVEAAKGTEVKLMFDYIDQSDVAPGNAVTSALLPYDRVALTAAEQVANGTFEGTTLNLTLQDFPDAPLFTPFQMVPPDVAQEVEEIGQKVTSGEIQVEAETNCE